jgi:hypothetical protein
MYPGAPRERSGASDSWGEQGVTWKDVAKHLSRQPIPKGVRRRHDPANLRWRYEKTRGRLERRAFAYYEAHRSELPVVYEALRSGQPWVRPKPWATLFVYEPERDRA